MNLIWKCAKCDSNCVLVESFNGQFIGKDFMKENKPKKCHHGGKARWELVE